MASATWKRRERAGLRSLFSFDNTSLEMDTKEIDSNLIWYHLGENTNISAGKNTVGKTGAVNPIIDNCSGSGGISRLAEIR
jgi:hypothetical protein